MTTAIYARVSSASQNTRSQEPDLKRWAAAQDGEVRWYRDNRVAADRRYMGKKLIVTGVVSRIDKDVLGRPCVVLTVGETPLDVVFCYLGKKHEDEVADLQPGNGVVIFGECRGATLTFPHLEGSRVAISAADAHALQAKLKQIAGGM